MLVLTRKTGQKLIINDNIEVVILESRGDTIKIGINAPKNVSIFREEIYTEIKNANKRASQNTSKSDLENAFNLLGGKINTNINAKPTITIKQSYKKQ